MFFSLVVSLAVGLLIGHYMIPILTKVKFGQEIRQDGPEAHLKKKGTPTMGGILFFFAVGIGMIVGNKIDYSVLFIIFTAFAFGATGLLKFLLENEELKNIETHFDFSRILSNASHIRKEKIETTQKYLKELEKNNYYHLFDIFDRKQKRKGIEYQVTIVSNCVITEKEAKNYLELSNEKIVMNYAGEVK